MCYIHLRWYFWITNCSTDSALSMMVLVIWWMEQNGTICTADVTKMDCNNGMEAASNFHLSNQRPVGVNDISEKYWNPINQHFSNYRQNYWNQLNFGIIENIISVKACIKYDQINTWKASTAHICHHFFQAGVLFPLWTQKWLLLGETAKKKHDFWEFIIQFCALFTQLDSVTSFYAKSEFSIS